MLLRKISYVLSLYKFTLFEDVVVDLFCILVLIFLSPSGETGGQLRLNRP